MVRVVLLFLLLGTTHSLAAGVEFVRVWPRWREAESFKRITEYFGGKENTGREIVLRTQSGERSGYYFLVRVRSGEEISRAIFQLHVIRPDSPEAKVYRFETSVPAKETVFQLGLTGGDWPGGEETNPVAWKLVLLDRSGRELAREKSFLWEKPSKS